MSNNLLDDNRIINMVVGGVLFQGWFPTKLKPVLHFPDVTHRMYAYYTKLFTLSGSDGIYTC